VWQLDTVRPCWWMTRTAPAVWWVCLAAAWEGRRLNKCGATTRRSPPCCSQLCTLWYCTHTHPAKHRPTASRELCDLSRAEWHNAIFDCTLPRVRRALHTTVLVQQ
jgi:hypothetical protein